MAALILVVEEPSIKLKVAIIIAMRKKILCIFGALAGVLVLVHVLPGCRSHQLKQKLSPDCIFVYNGSEESMAVIRAAIDRNRSHRQSRDSKSHVCTEGALLRQLSAATTSTALTPTMNTALDFVEELCEDMPGSRGVSW